MITRDLAWGSGRFSSRVRFLLAVFSGCDVKNKYWVRNSMGQPVYTAVEDSDCCERFCCGSMRSYGMTILDNYENEVLRLHRPLRCVSCCFPCCLQRLEVFAASGQLIGKVEEEWSILFPKFRLTDPAGQKLARIAGPFCTWSICGDVKDTDGNTIGRIAKQWSGLLKELFTVADNFSVAFSPQLDVTVKALIFAATFLIDFIYFEKPPEWTNWIR
ncbi:unnamed protein product [Darwinula stevensoni]|uniref:Phospholipid scramblase n=1 Tax=Darwinula stevensoni TaxID=69355 RepID=A0A7R9FRD3_9CRUS|nr:unnamed protein product [Darwinula stevensoni]CAG0901093.1 unnamed protein product [Darwinula stevensoni]